MILSISLTVAVSIDCPNIINLATELRMNVKQPIIMSHLLTDCCSTGESTCSNGHVTEINWSGLSLDGSIHGDFIPSGLLYLTLTINQITGIIPSSLPNGLRGISLDFNIISGSIPTTLPRELDYLSAYPNQLNGTIPSTLPSRLLNLVLRSNRMSGDLLTFPTTIKNLILGDSNYFGNHFTGTVRLNNPVGLLICENHVTDVIINDPISLSICDLSNNPLLGNPNIFGLNMCTIVGFYDPNLLPATLSKSFSTGFANIPTFLPSSALTNNFSAGIRSSYIICETATSKLNSSTELLKSGISPYVIGNLSTSIGASRTFIEALPVNETSTTFRDLSLISISTTDVKSSRKITMTIVSDQTASNISYLLNSIKPTTQEARSSNAFSQSPTQN